ncbi:UNVERIFIED_CONTAM: hypothetical protein FKN15_031002 [Acipenser sinensis]
MEKCYPGLENALKKTWSGSIVIKSTPQHILKPELDQLAMQHKRCDIFKSLFSAKL